MKQRKMNKRASTGKDSEIQIGAGAYTKRSSLSLLPSRKNNPTSPDRKLTKLKLAKGRL